MPCRVSILGAILLTSLVSGPLRAAGTIGIAVCDDFLDKYETCLNAKVAAGERPAFKTQVDQTRKTWSDLAKDPAAKSGLEASCRQTADQIKASLRPLGCTF
jgi:hypothetical protein